mmetsp:Transcript_9335/g.20298  ORF Transcript_9335/g.20298 Transcript_9335/m.20298 type:complete len:506 (-) Transcript_9335:276-1793(-)
MASYSTIDGAESGGEASAFLGGAGIPEDVHRQSSFRYCLDWVIDQFRDRPVRSTLLTLTFFFLASTAYTKMTQRTAAESAAASSSPLSGKTHATAPDDKPAVHPDAPKSSSSSSPGQPDLVPDGSRPTKKFSSLSEDGLQELFDSYLNSGKFMTPYTKNMTPDQRAAMYATFGKNLFTIDELNEKSNGGARYSITKFASYTQRELDDLKGYYAFEDDKFVDKVKKYWHSAATEKMDEYNYYYDYYDMFFEELSGYVEYKEAEMCGACGRYPDLEDAEKSDLPKSFDWREFGAVPAVRDQCHCGASYAFAIADNVAAAWFLARSNHHLTPLSPQYLASCDYYTYGCMGGWFAATFPFVHDMGLFKEEFYPFDSEGGKAGWCKGDMVDGAQPDALITSWTWIPVQSEEKMKLALVKNGPLVVGVSAKNLEFYDSGVDAGANCEYSGSSGGVDHAMLVVGWDVDEETKKEHWIVQNSWGNDWGEEGFWYPELGKNVCGLTGHVMTAFS